MGLLLLKRWLGVDVDVDVDASVLMGDAVAEDGEATS
jgi:hypothetical protein